VLHRLAAERRLEIVPNRGVRVPQPTIDEVKRVYEAHRVLEAGVIVQLVSMIDPAILAILDAHLAQERSAAERGDRAECRPARDGQTCRCGDEQKRRPAEQRRPGTLCHRVECG